MLGKLARWLRLLGYDSSYYRDIEDKKLLELAKINDRVLITRDKEVVQKAKKTGSQPTWQTEKNRLVHFYQQLLKYSK